VNEQRVRRFKPNREGEDPIVYWMSRDQRARDNWSLLFAQGLAPGRRRRLCVTFCLVPGFPSATGRQYGFMLRNSRQEVP
jgi:deoxyribodipyrimidine photo-lyase